MEVVQGGTAVLRAEFVNGLLQPVNVDIQSLEIFDSSSNLILDVPVDEILQEGTGRYRYTFGVPEDALMGVWTAIWQGLSIPDNIPMTGNETFEVVPVNSESLATVPQLRMLLNERIPEGGTEADTNFTDNELGLMIQRAGGSLYYSAAEGWYVKAGLYSMFIDVDESGSNRNLGEVFKHALSMGDRYRSAAKAAAEEEASIYEGRIPGKAISPWKISEDDPNVIYPFSGYEITYTRYFPLMRFTYSVMG